MPLIHSKSDAARSANIAAERRAGKPPAQAAAIAYNIQREAKATGGPIPMSGLRYEGLISSPTAGRTDKIPMSVPGGSYVIPADVVSALGQGNSMSGGHALHRAFRMEHRTKIHHFASGGRTDIVVSGGEFIVPPDKVSEVGDGDMNKGHDILDQMVRHVRRKNIRTLSKLPGPKK